VLVREDDIANVCEFGCTDECDGEFDVAILVGSTEMGVRIWNRRVGSNHIPPVLVGDISPSFKSSAPAEFAENLLQKPMRESKQIATSWMLWKTFQRELKRPRS
jgi:hypothetical protein